MLVLILVPVVGLCVAVLVVGLRLSSPSRAVVGALPAALRGGEPVEIASPSGSALKGWWVPGPQSGGAAVILMHGVWSNRARMIQRASMLHTQGFAVLLFDFQAHGESSGRNITYGRLEALDAAAATEFVRRRAPQHRVGAICVSLGGAAALVGPKPLDVDALVLESVYTDIDTALANRLRVGLGSLLGPPLTPVLATLFKLLLPPLLRVRPRELRPIDHIGRVAAPVLIASGTHDDRTTLAEAQTLYDRAPPAKTFWAVQGAGHVDLENHDPAGYWHVVLPFLTTHLRHAGHAGACSEDAGQHMMKPSAEGAEDAAREPASGLDRR